MLQKLTMNLIAMSKEQNDLQTIQNITLMCKQDIHLIENTVTVAH